MAEVEPQDAFMYFIPDKIKGESNDSALKSYNPVELKEFGLEGTNSTNVGSATTGGSGAGKVKFETVTFKKKSDSSTTDFWREMAKGTHFTEAYVILRRNQLPYLEFKFVECLISKVNTTQSGDEEAEDEISMDYGAVKISYTGQTKVGGAGDHSEAMWSRTLNAFTDTV